MDPRISVRSGKVSDDTKDHIRRVCTKLDKFFDRIIDCEVVVGQNKQGTEVEFVVKVPNQTLTATSVAENLYKAVDEVERRIEAQLRKYHDKKARAPLTTVGVRGRRFQASVQPQSPRRKSLCNYMGSGYFLPRVHLLPRPGAATAVCSPLSPVGGRSSIMTTAEEMVKDKGGEIICVPTSSTIREALQIMVESRVGQFW